MKSIKKWLNNTYIEKIKTIHVEIFIAALAVFFTFYQAILMYQQNQNSVLPWVDIKISTSDKESSIKVENSGVGPAILYGLKAIDLETQQPVLKISSLENKLYENWVYNQKNNINKIENFIKEQEILIDSSEKQIIKLQRNEPSNFDKPLNEAKKLKSDIVHLKEELKEQKSLTSKNIERYKNSNSSCGDIHPMSALKDGDSITIVNIESNSGISKEMNFDISICYCSVYDDCWISSFPYGKKEVRNCNSFTQNKIIECDY
jgi:hypothetical protein